MPGVHHDLTTTADLVIVGGRLSDGTLVDVVVDGPHVMALTAAGGGGRARSVVDARGALVLPAAVEPHAHLDKALTAGLVANPTGDLAGAIEGWIAARAGAVRSGTGERAARAALAHAANGTAIVRTHVDTGVGIGIDGAVAIEQVRERVGPFVEVQSVVCASFPLTGAAGRNNIAIARDALAAGRAVAVGGAPYLDARPVAALDALAELAASHGIGLDLHVDETLDPAVFTLPDLIALARGGFRGSIVAGHCVSLGVQPADVQRRVAEHLAETGISVVTLPQTNLYLQGRAPAGPVARGLPPLRALLDAGVRLAVGGDNVRDPFNPMGRNDPMESAALAVVAGHLTPAEAFAAVSVSARQAIGAGSGGPEVGAVADLVIVDADSLDDVVAGAARRRRVVHRGRLVADTVVHSELFDAPIAPDRHAAALAS